MQMVLETDGVLNSVKELSKQLEIDKQIDSLKKQLGGVVTNTIDKVATYSIKAMPIPDSFKDILYDVKESFKSKDFKEVIKTVINSSVREGLEILHVDKSTINDIKKVTNVAIKGGLIQGIKCGVDIVAKKYLNNSIVGNYMYDFFNKLKDAPLSKDFLVKMNKGITRIITTKEEFMNKCNEFMEAYNEFDIDKINEISKQIEEKVKSAKLDEECIRENKIIQNITTLVNNKNQKLTEAQLQLCHIM